MNRHEAEKALYFHTYDPSGVFTELRLGNNPGKDNVMSLINSLKVVMEVYSLETHMPRQVAMSCAIIMHFTIECINNLKDNNESNDLIDTVKEIEQAAYNVFTGYI